MLYFTVDIKKEKSMELGVPNGMYWSRNRNAKWRNPRG